MNFIKNVAVAAVAFLIVYAVIEGVRYMASKKADPAAPAAGGTNPAK